MSEPRFLAYTGTLFRSAGLNHQISNFQGLVREAVALDRVPVLPEVRLTWRFNRGRELRSRLESYLDFENSRIRMADGSWHALPFRFGIGPDRHSPVLRLGLRDAITPEQNERYPWVIRDVRLASGALWVRGRPKAPGEEELMVDFVPSARVRKLAEPVIAELGRYHAMHVRRGDRLLVHPTLFWKTRPKAILRRIEPWVSPGDTIYVLSHIMRRDFFDALRALYQIRRPSDFPALHELLSGKERDNFLLYSVEKEIMNGAEKGITTFRVPGHPYCLTDIPGWS